MGKWWVDFGREVTPEAHEPHLVVVQLLTHQLVDDVVRMVSVNVEPEMFGRVENGVGKPPQEGDVRGQ